MESCAPLLAAIIVILMLFFDSATASGSQPAHNRVRSVEVMEDPVSFGIPGTVIPPCSGMTLQSID
jgi:hypothetical protein